MNYHESPAIRVGRRIGVFRLNVLIRNLTAENAGETKEDLGAGISAFRSMKRALGCKGSRVGVLRYAKEVLAEVRNW